MIKCPICGANLDSLDERCDCVGSTDITRTNEKPHVRATRAAKRHGKYLIDNDTTPDTVSQAWDKWEAM